MLQEVPMQNDRRFRALIEHSSDAVALLTVEGIFTYASPSAEHVTGYPASELVGMNAFTLLHPDDLENVSQQFAMLFDRPGHFITIEYRVRHKNGSWRWMEGTATNLLGDPAVQAIVVNFRDTTERKELEQKLQYSEKKLRTLVESNILGVAVSDSTGRIHEINERFAQIVGYSWESFYQAATPRHYGTDGGLGLGLAIAKGIIEQHQGQIGVESVPGQGATFWFSLPLADQNSHGTR